MTDPRMVPDAEELAKQLMTVSRWAKEMAGNAGELVRLSHTANRSPDGWGAGGMGNRGGKGGHGDPPYRTVEQAEAAARPDKARDSEDQRIDREAWDLAVRADRLDRWLADFFGQWHLALGAMVRCKALDKLIANRADGRARQSLVIDCLACLRPVPGIGEDKIKSGYCPTCYRRWRRYVETEQGGGREPSHAMFRRLVQAPVPS